MWQRSSLATNFSKVDAGSKLSTFVSQLSIFGFKLSFLVLNGQILVLKCQRLAVVEQRGAAAVAGFSSSLAAEEVHAGHPCNILAVN